MKAAVLGSPVAHSLSPVLHAAGYAELGLADWTYGSFDLHAVDLAGFVAGLDADWRGLSLTMPLKDACLAVAAEVTPLALRAGAGNTLVRLPSGAWRADNTDVPGLVDALRPAWDPDWTLTSILGAGATARSALLAVTDLGVTQVHVYARNRAKAGELVAWAAAAAPQVEVVSVPLEQWTGGDEPAVVSTLPGGVANGFVVPGPRAGLLFDVVYAGWPTPLARGAAAAGMTVVGGLDLLVHQAARQFTLFTGRPAPLAAMLAAGRAQLSISTTGEAP